MHMPGHKRNVQKFPYLNEICGALDVTEVAGLDELHNARGVIADVCDRAAALWGANRTFLSVNGSTGALLAALYACTSCGDRVLVARNAHKSLVNGLELLRLKTEWAYPDVLPCGICGSISPQAVRNALKKTPCKAVVVTSPTYEGVISDLKGIAEAAHEQGALLIVDGAHGAHLDLSPYFVGGGVKQGADAVVCGIHKTLPALTQTALLHCADSLPAVKVSRAMSVFVTSSPSYLLMASVDCMLDVVEKQGEQLFSALDKNLDEFYVQAKRANAPLYCGEGAYAFDRTKLYFVCDGKSAKQKLREIHNIEAEYAWQGGVLLMSSIGDDEERLQKLAKALPLLEKPDTTGLTALPRTEKKRELFEEFPTRLTPLSQAAGKISAETVWVFPPAVPLLLKGEVITEQCAALLAERRRETISQNNSPKGFILTEAS